MPEEKWKELPAFMIANEIAEQERRAAMTHPTEAGERERIASRLEIRAAGGCNARAYITDPNCAARGRTVENWCSNCLTLRAADLLRTEPERPRLTCTDCYTTHGTDELDCADCPNCGGHTFVVEPVGHTQETDDG